MAAVLKNLHNANSRQTLDLLMTGTAVGAGVKKKTEKESLPEQVEDNGFPNTKVALIRTKRKASCFVILLSFFLLLSQNMW